MAEGNSVSLKKLAEQFQLRVVTSEDLLQGREVTNAEINRPALQLTGFYEYFEPSRVQIVGKVEYSYLQSLTHEERVRILERLFSTNISCLIVCRGVADQIDEDFVRIAEKYATPVLETQEATSRFASKLIQYLTDELAPRISMHGVMVDVFGEGVLILGESGVGKSETALELVERGHRLIADDIVEVHKTSQNELMARGVDVIRNLIELRGVGVLNVKELYGVQAVRINKTIDMVVQLEPWVPDKLYDRVGLTTETMTILETEVALYQVPVMVGRNLAMIIEAAALNHRQKKMGYNAAEELRDRVNESIKRKKQKKDLQN
ncbi:MAG: HPr(Ser) kinase/phosphatase [Firmicutes bacterium]|nr:HPr(Ser) kinase/phosphatase [Bacillota bacterium]